MTQTEPTSTSLAQPPCSGEFGDSAMPLPGGEVEDPLVVIFTCLD